MVVSRLALDHFRSWDHCLLDLAPGVTILQGANGLGKTNIVEALEVLATGSSHRATSSLPLVQRGHTQATIRANVSDEPDEPPTTIEATIRAKGANRARINGGSSRYMRDIAGMIPLVAFTPDDQRLVAGDPGARRQFMNQTASMLMRHTPPDIMNVLARSVLQLYAYDDFAEDRSPEHEIHTALSLISRLPRIMVLAYYAKQAAFNHGSMIMHRFIPGQSTAETILSMLRPDRQFTPEEARMLDIMLCLHAEHGGGNNSTFTARVLTSSDTDPYSTYAGAIGSLKGHRHGGANHQVRAMQAEIKENVRNWEDDDEVAAYLAKIVNKQAYDGTGLVYGMGHAVYTLSDPRAVICKRFAEELARGTEFEAEFNLLQSIERLAPEVILREKGTKKDMCANVDMYSGFVYSMMGIPQDLFTPLFACARMAGWAAHRFEEIGSGKRIIRPAYKTARPGRRDYLPIADR